MMLLTIGVRLLSCRLGAAGSSNYSAMNIETINYRHYEVAAYIVRIRARIEGSTKPTHTRIESHGNFLRNPSLRSLE